VALASESRPRASLALIPLYLLSGACGLCFEILWARQLQVAIGATSKAVTAVVSVFMVGLALGNAVGARLAPRLRRPALAYGLAEIGIGLSATLVTLLLPGLENLGSLGLRYLAAILLLVVPSGLMGMTFPLVSQACDPRASSGASELYAANTAGAALGCLLTGFLGIGLLGIRGTAHLAALGNLTCGVAAFLLFRRAAVATPTADAPKPRVESGQSSQPRTQPRTAILTTAGLCGASALAAEILWTRALLPYLNSSSYAFAAIMATFLVGLSLGSAWVAARCSHLDTRALARTLAFLQIALALLVAVSPHLMALAESLIPVYIGIRRVATFAGWLAMVGAMFAKAAVVVIPPAFIMGASLPMCIALLGRSGRPGGQVAGLASAVNTVGGVAGSLLAGFALLPLVGSVRGSLWVATGSLAAAAAMLVWVAAVPRRRVAVVIGGAVLCLLVTSTGSHTPFLGRLAAGAQALLVDEGPQDTTAVIERTTPGGTERTILSNGISYAGDSSPAQRYMALLAHLPALLATDISRTLVICIGTGTTAGNLALYREVSVLDLVDISPAVHRTLPLFAHVNYAVWTDPRVTIHEADGRQFMTHATSGYGVITLEPPPPRAAGAASLYTSGLYQRAHAALRPDGILAQWLPLHGMTEVEILMLARTFLAEFPEAALFMLNPDEAALLGSPRPLRFDVDRVKQRLQDVRVRSALARIGFAASDADGLAASLLALAPVHGSALRALVGDGPLVTDDQPLIEQFATLLTSHAQASFDPDGHRGFLRRVLAVVAPGLPVHGPVLAGLDEARASLRLEMQDWARRSSLPTPPSPP